jgi:predicted component of type VI protein secretion system
MRRHDVGPRREPSRPVLRWQGAAGRVEEHALSNARPATIGRDATCTIALDSRLVSKAHALVEFRDGEYTIQDLESANGTRVNGEATSVRVLEPGDRIAVGDVELTFLDLGADGAGAGSPADAGGSKAVRLALAASVTLIVMLGLLFTLIRGLGTPAANPIRPVEALAPAPPELLEQLRQSSASAPVVNEVVQHAAMAGVPPGQALNEEGRLRLDTERWRDAALLLAAAVARDPKNAGAASAFEQAAAHLDRAASKALAAAELAQFGMRYEDALLHADGVLQLVDRRDPRYDRALKIAEQARSATRAVR